MFKKIISCAAAVSLMFGAGAVLPEGFAAQSGIVAKAEETLTYGDYKYTVLSDGTVEISEYTGSDSELTIPSEIDGKSVTSIGKFAFENCNSLISITIPDSVINVDSTTFGFCDNLTSINIGINNSKYSSVNGVLYNKNKTELICCPEGKTGITILDTVTTIGDEAFFLCSSLTNITIPSGVKDIGDCALTCCENLISINVNSENTNYSSTEGVLYNKDKTILLCCPGGKSSLAIPDSVTSIGNSAFFECMNFTNITIPDSVTNIGDEAFSGCESLISIIIPNSVICIGENVFEFCDNVTIKCNKDSYAHQYAINKEIAYELLDDTSAPTHTHTYTSKISEQPTCTKEGRKQFTCSQCGDVYDEILPKTDHKYVVTDKIAPTYDEEGETVYKCSVCGDTKLEFTAKLKRTSIAKATVTGISDRLYTGSAYKPAPTVKLNGKTLKKGTDYTVSYKNNKAIGKATVTITGKGAYNGKVTKTFMIYPKPTTIKSLTSPKTKQIKVVCKKTTGVTGYQISYSTSKKFTKSATKTVNVTSTSKTIKSLKKGKTYYVKVRTYKKVGSSRLYSTYTAVKKIKVK
ncbi:MAG: leucine-rich repeat protein [Ruminococcus sp.]|nr:leucine-rich repeat protein [Ruminococcus sp.]